MKRVAKTFVRTFVLVLAIVLLLCAPVLAISDPNSGPTIERVDVFRHCLESNDMLVLVQYYLNYTSNPDETITQAYLGRLMSAGDVELANVAPYAYYDLGYDHGVFSLYLSATEASGYWGTACSARFEGNPTFSWQDLSASSAMTGAMAYDGSEGVPYTDETTEANSAAADDMNLLPTTPAVNDAYYFGGSGPFDLLTVNLGTQGDGVWTLVWEYWNGSDWLVLDGTTDGTAHFRAAPGNRSVDFTLPGDWAVYTVNSVDAYWIRARVSAYTSVVTAPEGTQSWTNVAASPPSTIATTLNWHATTTSKATELLLGSNVLAAAGTLSDYWSVSLTTVTTSGIKLSSYGEQYFANAIPNISQMVPSIFPAGIEAPEYEEEVHTQSYRDTLLSRLDGTMAGNALQGLSDWTTVPLTVVKAIMWLFVIGLSAYWLAVAVKDLRPALFLVLLMMPLGNLIGMLTLTFTIVGALLCVIALGYAFFYQKAGG